MSKRSEAELDAALTALARDMHEAAPRPGADLAGGVLADAALTVLAREAAEAAPRPSPALVARILADAAGAVAARPAPRAAAARAGGRPAGGRLLDLLFGWRAGAVAAMTLALAIGFGVGFEMEPGALPILDGNVEEGASMTLAGLGDDLDFIEGL